MRVETPSIRSKGLIITTAYYWDRDDNSREFARRLEARMKRKPANIQACYTI
jgi:branched-chain amino acid transport system substrate-binding protein